MNFRWAATWIAVACGVSSCGGGQTRISSVFASDWEDDGGRSIRAIREKVAGIAIPLATDVAVGTSEQGLVGMPLSEGQAWTYRHAIDARPVLAGSVVVGTGSNELFVLDAVTGRPLWTRRAGGSLRGAGDDGRTTVISLGTTGDTATTLLAVDHNGTVLRQLEVAPAVGIPAIVGNYVFLPWQNQYVSVYDLVSGDEAGRVVLREQVSRAFTGNRELYFGEVGLFRFDDRISQASANKASHVGLPTRELPGTPKWFNPGTEPLGVSADARDKIQLFARPTAGGELGIDSDRFVATYFRIAVGLEAKSGSLAWVHSHSIDIIGGAAFPGGVALCDAEGTVTFLGAKTGQKIGTVSLGQKIKSCVVQADGLTRAEPETSPGALATQIAEAIHLNDPQMVMIQRVLLRELSHIPDELTTRLLVDMASNPRTPPLLLADARSALASRRNGASYMIEALGRHYDFLKDILIAPPVGPLADALAGMKEKRAAPALASHLSDPADTPDDLKRAAAALEKLGGKEELPALKNFFALYRTTADDDDLVAAVVSAAEALVELGGAEGRAIVEKGAEDPLTLGAVKPRLEALLEAHSKGTLPAADTAAAKKR